MRDTRMGNPDHKNRQGEDFYSTPDGATLALLKYEQFPGTVWECAAGDGAMSRHFPGCLATDLVDRGEATVLPGVNFLNPQGWYSSLEVDHVVTNPPFRQAWQFAEQGLRVSRQKVALLLRLQFLESAARFEFFQNTPLARVYIFSKRISCHRNGDTSKTGGMQAHAWFIWEHGHQGPPALHWIDPATH